MAELKPAYRNDEYGISLYLGDCLDVLDRMPAESVQCCVTSPPYWGLRDYGTATWEGGDEGCDHIQRTNKHSGAAARHCHEETKFQFSNSCGKCGARRIDSQLGLEPTPDEFVANLVEVFRKVKRVLRGDGTVWLNLGDSYVGNSPGSRDLVRWPKQSRNDHQRKVSNVGSGLKPKDLCGIPWRVAFALQEDGWWLRQDIVWSKPNPMPESCTDRCTKSHEYIFLLSKSARYYFDHEAIKEPAAYAGQMRGGSTNRYEQNEAGMDCRVYDDRNKRSVWTVNTQSFKGAHFATFPEKLIEPCILAGCPEGGTVLDPFAGSGTVGVVCVKHGRQAALIELSPDYAAMAEKRLKAAIGDPMLFSQPVTEVRRESQMELIG